ncbi:MAG: 1-acyl-sn-glycerol-3-phosphate acyltransferase [Acidimicrobiia bacterium]|nr:1-acyl-sn-glycerol-3-phosphate acyltransferase [Acidimicrobiia bacterium]
MLRLFIDSVRSFITYTAMMVATIIVTSTVIIIASVNRTSPVIDRVIHWWSWTWLWVTGTSLEVRGSFDPEQSYVVISNHSSWLDIMANFIATPVPLRFLAKKELFQIPLLAPAMRAIGIVEIDRSKAVSLHEWINEQAATVANRAQSIMVYPEGTRTRTGELQRFKVGAFFIAVENQLPVLPVAIHGSWDAWPPGPLVHGGSIVVEIGEPIPTEGLTKDDVRGLTRNAEGVIARMLEGLRSPASG